MVFPLSTPSFSRSDSFLSCGRLSLRQQYTLFFRIRSQPPVDCADNPTRHANFEIRDAVFVGGVDLNGNLYFDAPDMSPLLRTVRSSGIHTIYAPPGVSEMICLAADPDCSVTVIEAQSAEHLISMAAAANRID